MAVATSGAEKYIIYTQSLVFCVVLCLSLCVILSIIFFGPCIFILPILLLITTSDYTFHFLDLSGAMLLHYLYQQKKPEQQENPHTNRKHKMTRSPQPQREYNIIMVHILYRICINRKGSIFMQIKRTFNSCRSNLWRIKYVKIYQSFDLFNSEQYSTVACIEEIIYDFPLLIYKYINHLTMK